jgi:hypothetical protein
MPVPALHASADAHHGPGKVTCQRSKLGGSEEYTPNAWHFHREYEVVNRWILGSIVRWYTVCHFQRTQFDQQQPDFWDWTSQMGDHWCQTLKQERLPFSLCWWCMEWF